MKKYAIGFFALLMIVFSACAQQKKTTKSKTSKITSSSKITSVKMSRTSCFGRCPTYNIEIFKDGLVRYTNVRYTPDSGVFEKNIGVAEVNEIFNEFKKNRVDTCQDKYILHIADLPGLNFTIDYPQRTKTIMHAHFGPAFLKATGRMIDEKIKIDNTWKRVADVGRE